MGIGDKMHTSCEREAPSRQRTRKKDLCSCPPFRSTNPTKTEFGAIIRATTQNDCDLLSAATQANQRQGTNECITRLNSTNNKNGPVLIKYICDFYPSITEKGTAEALDYAKQFVTIKTDQLEVIFYCKNSVLFHGGEAWVKKKQKKANFMIVALTFPKDL